jgi:fatty-acyl-CoA synthase
MSAPDLAYSPLTPTAFLDRSAYVHGDRLAVVDGDSRLDYAALQDRCLRQAGLLAGLGVAPGDRVAVLAPNGRLMLESHYGVPYSGAVLVTLNTRLAAAELAHILEHSGARVLLHHPDLTELAWAATQSLPDMVLLDGGEAYERLLAEAAPHRVEVEDERGLMALGYTSGTTGTPKGVMYHHRGAYLQALAMVDHFGLGGDSVYLWTLPMFHCNGWCFTWAVTAAGGTHVCLPKVEPAVVWETIQRERVTNLCGAPTVLISLLEEPTRPAALERPVRVAVGGAPPTPSMLERCAEIGLEVTHVYGLTETFGPAAICDWRTEWDALPLERQALLRARQGVANVAGDRLRVVDEKGADVPADAATIGEVAMRGNTVMLGYYRDPEATAAAAPDGWFRTGDLGVMHPDGYLEIRDRAKDVIVSGGENISSVEVEVELVKHPAVLEAAVVAAPDPHWGERPVAFVSARGDAAIDSDELRAWLRGRLAGYKIPDRIEAAELPKTASGKIRKDVLRRSLGESAGDGMGGGTDG